MILKVLCFLLAALPHLNNFCLGFPWSDKHKLSISNCEKEWLLNSRSGLKNLQLKQFKSDAQTLSDILDKISHHSLSTRFDMFQPILGENLKKILTEPFKEKKERIPIESGLKIPIPRLGWMYVRQIIQKKNRSLLYVRLVINVKKRNFCKYYYY